MRRIVGTSRICVTLALAGAPFLATGVRAETVVLDCVDYNDSNTCPSHWVINSDTKTVTWHWCESPDTTERRNVEMTDEGITFDEDFMERHYDFNRKTGHMTITAVGKDYATGQPTERFDDGESMCRVAG